MEAFNPATAIPNLGIAAFAIFIMWKMYTSSFTRLKEKDQELIVEIDKRDKRNEDQQRTFIDFTSKIHESNTLQLSKNTEALALNTSAFHENTKVVKYFSEHLTDHNRPVIIQNKVSTAPENK